MKISALLFLASIAAVTLLTVTTHAAPLLSQDERLEAIRRLFTANGKAPESASFLDEDRDELLLERLLDRLATVESKQRASSQSSFAPRFVLPRGEEEEEEEEDEIEREMEEELEAKEQWGVGYLESMTSATPPTPPTTSTTSATTPATPTTPATRSDGPYMRDVMGRLDDFVARKKERMREYLGTEANATLSFLRREIDTMRARFLTRGREGTRRGVGGNKGGRGDGRGEEEEKEEEEEGGEKVAQSEYYWQDVMYKRNGNDWDGRVVPISKKLQDLRNLLEGREEEEKKEEKEEEAKEEKWHFGVSVSHPFQKKPEEKSPFDFDFNPYSGKEEEENEVQEQEEQEEEEEKEEMAEKKDWADANIYRGWSPFLPASRRQLQREAEERARMQGFLRKVAPWFLRKVKKIFG